MTERQIYRETDKGRRKRRKREKERKKRRGIEEGGKFWQGCGGNRIPSSVGWKHRLVPKYEKEKEK